MDLSQNTTKSLQYPANTQISLHICEVRSVFVVLMKKLWIVGYLQSAEKDYDQTWCGFNFVGFIMVRLMQ